MAIIYNAVGVKIPPFKHRKTTNWIRKVAETYHKKIGDISYVFCSDAEILRVNQEYLHHDYYTDIISFDYSAGNTLSGDLFISTETVRSNAAQYHTDEQEELRRVMIHGILHLCGFGDKTARGAAMMRMQENEALLSYEL
ncbi:endoribonuclease YbeY [Bacteroidia bacterium]|nr:endoribonuclease YbeY [Bacteroidia bacterium]